MQLAKREDQMVPVVLPRLQTIMFKSIFTQINISNSSHLCLILRLTLHILYPEELTQVTHLTQGSKLLYNLMVLTLLRILKCNRQ